MYIKGHLTSITWQVLWIIMTFFLCGVQVYLPSKYRDHEVAPLFFFNSPLFCLCSHVCHDGFYKQEILFFNFFFGGIDLSIFLVCCTWSLFNNAWIKHFVALSKVSISSFWHACTQNGLEKTIMNIFNCDVIYFDCPWMFPPFKGHKDKLSKVEYNWNLIQSFIQMWIKRTFGHLKWRWRILLQTIDVNLQNIPNIVGTRLLLHNICTMMGKKFNDD